MSQEINISSYPEGYNEVLKLFSFVPDEETRNVLLAGLVQILIMM